MPRRGERGGFWEDRGDRRHTGVDLYAPEGSPVIACADGRVVQIGLFTSPKDICYWRETWFCLVRQVNGLYVRYAEMGQVCVGEGDYLAAGERVGSIGRVLDLDKVDASAPFYIRRLKAEGFPAMLHLEMLKAPPQAWPDYRGGNWFGEGDAPSFLDPQAVFDSAE
ncbi:MAG: M23 family metallopeptidase [candidate division KSB1 bacterium]|nr:M23 family metallopeptidase [candidate division KSB1 bacterium]